LEAVELATGATRRIAAGRDVAQPRWSPNGHRIAYWGVHNGTQRDLWTIPAAGGTPVPVTNDKPVDATPVWSADGTELYFVSNRGGRSNLWRIAIDERTGIVRGEPELVPAPASYTLQPNLARDGKLLVYESCVFNENIQRIGFDARKERVSGAAEWMTEGLRRASDPSLSPDGQWLAFYTYGDPQQDIFLRKTDQSEEQQLTNDAFRDFMPRWSPLGDRLAFFTDASGRYEIYTMNPDGSGRRQISYSPENSLGYLGPVWSPDAIRMAITLRGTGGSALIDLTVPWPAQTPQPLPPLTGQTGYFFAIAWSPDGQRLAGTRWTHEGEQEGLWLYDLTAQRYEQLTTEGKDPFWFSDSRRLLYHSSTLPSVWVVDTATKEFRKIYEIGPENNIGAALLSPDEKLLYTVTGRFASTINLLRRP
jgi:Tol biopolymer transport system component